MATATDPFALTPPVIDIGRPAPARVYDSLLGGSYNFGADRAFAQQARRVMPDVAMAAQLNRGFVVNAVGILAERGFRQFLDLGAGMPTPSTGSPDSIARRIHPNVRVVYVDNDLVAVAQGELLLHESDDGVKIIDADLTEPEDVLDHPVVKSTLDWTQPVALLLCAALHFVPDIGNSSPYEIVARYRDALKRGDALALTHGTADGCPEMADLVALHATKGRTYAPRSRADIARFTDGFDLLEPGLALTGHWNGDRTLSPAEVARSGAYGFIGIRR